MSFDAYHKWLGIPAPEQPPDYYRLLGIERFEDDPDVIESAADQRMAMLRTKQAREHALLAQDLLNEVAGARVCLLNPEKKAAYDARLRGELAPRSVPKRVSSNAVHEPGAPVKIATQSGSGGRRSMTPIFALWLSAAAGAIFVVVVMGFLIPTKAQTPLETASLEEEPRIEESMPADDGPLEPLEDFELVALPPENPVAEDEVQAQSEGVPVLDAVPPRTDTPSIRSPESRMTAGAPSLPSPGNDKGPGGSSAPNGKTVTKGSFSARTVPEDPRPGESYSLVIHVDYGKAGKQFQAGDVTGTVTGAEGYRKKCDGRNAIYQTKSSEIIIKIPGAAEKVRDVIDVRSAILNESQQLKLEF